MKKALIHEWFSSNSCGGAEQCIKSFVSTWDDFDIFGLIDNFKNQDRKDFLNNKTVHTSFIQNLPFGKTKYKNYFPLFPFAIEQFNLTNYDLILSSSHLVAKGILTHSNQLHISYVHTPVRYAWDLYHRYLEEHNLSKGLKSLMAKYFLHQLRMWDLSTINRVDYYIANSKFIAKRIKKIYGKDATVIYPPVDTEQFSLEKTKENYYLTASRLVPYKKIDLIVDAFSQTNHKLVVIGDGPDLKKIKKKATKNIEILGYQSNESLISHMKKAKAFVFAAEEDFGIIPVEAQACGTPVICLNKGGTAETVTTKTGVFFKNQTIQDIVEAITFFEKNKDSLDPDAIRQNALRFNRLRFEKEIKAFVEEKCNHFFN